MRRMHLPTPAELASSEALFPPDALTPAHAHHFEPTMAAARARLEAVDPVAYARTRNALEGAVTGLSPYITHGFLTLFDVLSHVQARVALDVQHKFVYELGWRAFFRHVWQHRGDGILSSLHMGVLPDGAYATSLPDDIRCGCTGIPVIDQSVRALHETGYLHNHARMWLASHVVHQRKVHWRVGADWLFAQLLDGDLASNHLSWQWVAGTGSHKPYLFNAENVARFAPSAWHSPGTVVDTTYDELERMARHTRVYGAPGPQRSVGPLTPSAGITSPAPAWLNVVPPDPATAGVTGRDVWLVHPWSLGERPVAVPADARIIAWLPHEFHRAWPWSEKRWQFVGQRMAALTDTVWQGPLAEVTSALSAARRVFITLDPHLPGPLPSSWTGVTVVDLFPPVAQPCASFSQWWKQATRGMDTAAQLLTAARVS